MTREGVRFTIAGNLGIMVWRRGRWTSMPHLSNGEDAGAHLTACGRKVALFDSGVDGIALTGMSAKDFSKIGCGLCWISLTRDWRATALAADPDARLRFLKSLKTMHWEATVS